MDGIDWLLVVWFFAVLMFFILVGTGIININPQEIQQEPKHYNIRWTDEPGITFRMMTEEESKRWRLELLYAPVTYWFFEEEGR